ncbi:hypothetical protein FAZ69_08470 [Trinickia terrae]|uniref:Conjugal transfer protein n=1 Tax=Trinickia terrae TaxID=2571161 RepID=A0A4U1I9I5_9BURK|nr:hypothetical protein [Trinickia terrae]TKC90171.1 hypothetical protein FAZ69_08470 [Trinickia terrae]
MNRTLKKTVAGMTLLSFAGVVAASGCPAVADSIWEEGMVAAGGAMTSAITGMVNAVSAERSYNLQRVTGALKVLAEQINSSANNSNSQLRSAKEAAASVQADIYNFKGISKALFDYGPRTGQGYNPCVEQDRSKNLNVALGEASNDMQEKVIREIDAAPGAFVPDRGVAIAQRMRDAANLYCTPGDAAAGLCSAPGPMAGKDLDASNFFASAPGGSTQSNAKSALLNNLFGLPAVALPASAVATPVGQAFLDQKRTSDAVNSVAQASLKSIQSWTEARSSTGGATDNQSVLDALSSKVDTYAGGADYDNWAAAQTSQSERGLLVELAKMEALDLSMGYMEYQSEERREAAAAAKLALMAGQMPNSDATAQAALARSRVTQ